MRKHDEGYALVLVLVVMVVLSIAATSLMSVGLRNLKGQQAVGDRMVDKYAAQGEIEKLIATLTLKDTYDKSGEDKHDKQLSAWITNDLIKAWIEASPEGMEVEAELKNLTIDEDTVPEGAEPQGSYTGAIALTVKHSTAVIECELSITGNYILKDAVAPSYIKTYEITPEEPTYLKYVISHTAATEAAEGGGEG